MDFLLCLIYTLCFYLLCFIYRHALRFVSDKGRDCCSPTLPPGPPPLPVIGNLLSLGRLPHRSLHELSLTYGPILKLSLGQITTVIVSSPSLARDILQTHDSCFSNRFIPDAVTALGHDRLGLPFIPISPLFKTLRKVYSTQMFASSKLDANQHLRKEQVRQLVREVEACSHDGRAVDVGEASFRTTLELLSNTAFSTNLVDPGRSTGIGELKQLLTNMMGEVGSPNIADYFPALKSWDPQGRRRRLEGYFRRMFDIFSEMMEKRMAARGKRGWQWKDDVLEIVLDISQDSDGDADTDAFDHVLIKHLFLDVFAAGTDTTSNTLE